METFCALLAFCEGIHLLIPLTKMIDAELWCVLSSAPEQTVGQSVETQVIWDATALWRHCNMNLYTPRYTPRNMNTVGVVMCLFWFYICGFLPISIKASSLAHGWPYETWWMYVNQSYKSQSDEYITHNKAHQNHTYILIFIHMGCIENISNYFRCKIEIQYCFMADWVCISIENNSQQFWRETSIKVFFRQF